MLSPALAVTLQGLLTDFRLKCARRAQLLLCLGMLLPSSEAAQDQVASSSTAVTALVVSTVR